MTFRRLVKKVIPTQLFHKIEPYGHWLEAVIAQIIYGFPARKLTVIGVTGTDGKTTTSSYIAQILKSSGKKVALMTTVELDYGNNAGSIANPTRLTTIGALELAKQLHKVKKAGAQYLVIEITSHALAQHRVYGVPIDICVMTNVDHEHLDYHGTFENYRAAKLRLFALCNANLKGHRTGIVNADDPSADLFRSSIANSIGYGTNSGDLKAFDIDIGKDVTTYQVEYAGVSYVIKTSLPGSFNVYNSLAALGVGIALGLSQAQIESGIFELKSVEGRMNRIDEGQDFDVIVDYAHTPESFEKIFSELRPVVKQNMICVFGSAGRRDEAKREAQGEIAGKYCDFVIVTEEDDRDIDGNEIMTQIAHGAQKRGKKLGLDLFTIHRREDAISAAIALAKPGDMVLLLGKGHEKSILTNGPKAAELRHLKQDDTDRRRVVSRNYDEIASTHEALKKLLNKN